MTGMVHLAMNDMRRACRRSNRSGAYDLAMDWRGQQAQLTLKTVKGPMLLSGGGKLERPSAVFRKGGGRGRQEERLANLLNLLGQRRREGNKNIIALEFK